MNRRYLKPWFSALILWQISLQAPASVYTAKFGSCASRGEWTEEALGMTQKIIDISSQLANDPRCNSLAVAMNGFLESTKQDIESLGTADSAKGQGANQLSQLKDEVFALRDFLFDPHIQKDVAPLIYDRTLRAASLSMPEAGSSPSETPRQSENMNTLNYAYSSLSRRFHQTTEQSIDMLNSLVSTAIAEQQCLMGSNVSGPLISSLFRLSSVFVGSGQAYYGTKIAELINNLSVLLRQAHFANVEKTLNQVQLRNSLSCMIETVSENYCSNVDTANLLKEHRHRHPVEYSPTQPKQFRKSQGNVALKEKSELEGYFVLTQLVPIISSWVQRIQRGVEPRLESDANNKNRVMGDVLNFFMREQLLYAVINEDKATIEKLPDFSSKKQQIIKTLTRIQETFFGDRGGSGNNENFFTNVTTYENAIFKMLGIQTPPQIFGLDEKGAQIPPITPRQWLLSKYDTIPLSNDPEKLIDSIRDNVRKMTDEGSRVAIQYFNQWFIYDQAGLFFASYNGLVYNVKTSLIGIRNYFLRLKDRRDLERGALPVIFDTLQKLNTVLAAFEKVEELGDKINEPGLSEEDQMHLTELAVDETRNLIEVVYDNLMVLKAQWGFLENRTLTAVTQDFQAKIRNNNFGMELKEDQEKIRDIYFATGDAVYQQLTAFSRAGQSDLLSDISSAQNINLENLRALESLIKDSFVAQTAYLKRIATYKGTTNDDIFNDSLRRAWKDYWTNYSGWSWTLIFKPFDFVASFLTNSNRYPRNLDTGVGINQTRGITETTDKSYQREFSRFCIQSLAFDEWAPFYDLCKGVVLESPYYLQIQDGTDEASKKNAKAAFKEMLSVDYEQSLLRHLSLGVLRRSQPKFLPYKLDYPENWQSLTRDQQNELISKNQDQRICALRTYHRNNYIVWLTQQPH